MQKFNEKKILRSSDIMNSEDFHNALIENRKRGIDGVPAFQADIYMGTLCSSSSYDDEETYDDYDDDFYDDSLETLINALYEASNDKTAYISSEEQSIVVAINNGNSKFYFTTDAIHHTTLQTISKKMNNLFRNREKEGLQTTLIVSELREALSVSRKNSVTISTKYENWFITENE